ncbi:MAG: hypothetical protein COC00_002425 [Rhizobiales bacterium]|nr:hypothetical protein [Hyphomicrobiales bacterium]
MRAILFSLSIFSLVVFALPYNAFAHLGHVGELAGHGHWIAIGAGIAIAGLGALLGKKSKDEDAFGNQDENEAEDLADGDIEGATA